MKISLERFIWINFYLRSEIFFLKMSVFGKINSSLPERNNYARLYTVNELDFTINVRTYFNTTSQIYLEFCNYTCLHMVNRKLNSYSHRYRW